MNTCELRKDRINSGLTKKAGYKRASVNERVCVRVEKTQHCLERIHTGLLG